MIKGQIQFSKLDPDAVADLVVELRDISIPKICEKFGIDGKKVPEVVEVFDYDDDDDDGEGSKADLDKKPIYGYICIKLNKLTGEEYYDFCCAIDEIYSSSFDVETTKFCMGKPGKPTIVIKK